MSTLRRERRGAAGRALGLALGCAIVCGALRSQTVLWEVEAATPGTIFGEYVLSAGDVDGDGASDLLVGEPGYNPGGSPDTGRILLFSGGDQTVLLSIVGPHAGAGFGSVLGRSGDLTGDGVPEVVARAYEGGPLPWTQQATFVRVHSLGGGLIAQWAGETGAVVGDLDANGLTDLVVVDKDWFPPVCTGKGRAYAISGGVGPVVGQWQCSGFEIGYALEPLGDVSGDGQPDFAFSSSGYWNGQIPSSLWVHSGLSVNPAWVQGFYNPPFISTATPTAVAAAGDVDGDGVGDILAGFPEDTPFLGATPTGMARVMSGATGGILHTFVGAFLNQRFGKSVGHLGDLDGDGRADLLVSGSFMVEWYPPTPPLSGTSPLQGRAYVFSGETGGLLLEVSEAPPWDGFGSSVDGLGDLDGDDFPDFAVGEAWRRSPDVGRVIAFSAAPAGIGVFGASCASAGGPAPRIAGWPSASLGSTFTLRLSRALPNAPGLLLLGLSNSLWSGISLPVDLGPVGFPGCQLLVSPDFVLGTSTQGSSTATGRAAVSLPIPTNPSLSNAVFYAQWIVVGLGGGLSAELTRGLAVSVHP